MKICTKCKTNEAPKNYAWCKSCRKEYDRIYFQSNKVKRQDQQKAIRKERLEWWLGLKSNLSCKDCGENHPAVLQFHHRNPEEKKVTLSDALRKGWSKVNILKEIEKCDVLCANCHLKFHWKH